jgi:tyrosinase
MSLLVDPVFFLHHAQLDRLWWTWQALHEENRLDYIGVASHHSKEKASVTDLLLMGGLAPDIAVSQVLTTRGDLLCYKY